MYTHVYINYCRVLWQHWQDPKTGSPHEGNVEQREHWQNVAPLLYSTFVLILSRKEWNYLSKAYGHLVIKRKQIQNHSLSLSQTRTHPQSISMFSKRRKKQPLLKSWQHKSSSNGAPGVGGNRVRPAGEFVNCLNFPEHSAASGLKWLFLLYIWPALSELIISL